MARKVVRETITREGDFEERERPREVEKVDPAQEAYSDFMQKFKGTRGCRVKVYRLGPRGRQYCFHDPPDQVDEERIRLFHARQSYASEEGQYQIVVEVNGEDQPPFNVNIAPQVGIPGTESSAPSGGIADVVRLLTEQNQRLEQRLMGSERTPMLEMVDGLAKLDQLRGGANTNQPPIEAILKAVEIGQRLNAPEAETWTSLLMSTIKENSGTIVAIARSIMTPRPPVAPAPPQVPPPQVEVQPPISTEIPVEEQEKMMLLDVFQWLKRKARAGSKPELYVAMIDDNREDPIYARLISYVHDNDFSAFVALDPELDKFPNRDFFRGIYNGIQQLLIEDGAMETDTGRESGNGADTSGNGAGGKKRGKRS